jgi:hypothetical protein
MAGLGRKTWASGDTLTAADVNGYLMEQSVMVFAGTAARSSAIPSPSAGMVAYSTATSLQVYNGSAWVSLSTGYGVATGGTATSITVAGTAYTLLNMTADTNFVVSTAGIFDLLIVGGGGGGATSSSSVGTGGGAGAEVEQMTMYFDAGTYAVTIGAGGASGVVGNSTRIATTVSVIGGGSGGTVNQSSAKSQDGGSGGGANGNNPTAFGVSLLGSTSLGNSGGQGTASISSGGGGGGIGSAGANSTSGAGGNGGTGLGLTTFTGATITSFVAAGGGGSGVTTQGTGGSSVGGNAGAVPTIGAANSGSGGGAGFNATGAAGGSGRLLVRFKV